MKRLFLTLALSVVLGFFFTTPFISIALLVDFYINGVAHIKAFPLLWAPVAWWVYLWHWPFFLAKHLFLTWAAITLPFTLLAWFSIMWRFRSRRVKPARPGSPLAPPVRAASETHGSAAFLPLDTLTSIFNGPHPHWGGIPVAERMMAPTKKGTPRFHEKRPETWAGGGTAPLITATLEDGPVSGLIVGGSGSGKTTGTTIPACYAYFGSMVILDPSTQVGPMVRDYRKRIGQEVAEYGIGRGRDSINVLARFDITSDTIITELEEFVDWCGADQKEDGQKGENKFFADTARELEICMLAHLLWSDNIPRKEKTVLRWREMLSEPERELPYTLRKIYSESQSDYARQLAGTLMNMTEKTWSGVYKHATTELRWLANPAVARLLSEDSVDPLMILQGRLTAIVQIKENMLKKVPQVARVLIGSFARIMLNAEGATATPVPFLLDEMDLLGAMPILMDLHNLGRKAGVAMFPMWQSVGQIEKTWGREGKKSWYASAAWRLYIAVNDQETAAEVAERCGKYTVVTRTENVNRSFQKQSGSRGWSDSESEAPRELVTAYEVQTAFRRDTAFLVPQGEPVALVMRPLFYRRPEMVAAFEADKKFVRKPATIIPFRKAA